MMQISTLRVCNFGPFHGEHVLDLSETDADRPIVLVGGLNGAGKTSILDAIHLAFFGRRASLAKYGTGGYDAYLRSSVNDNASPEEGAAVELSFFYGTASNKAEYLVRRSWRVLGARNRVDERIVVFRDGKQLDISREQWDLIAETVMPRSVAPLFFFDGEKIEQLADLQKARERVEAGVLSLLGLDLVDQLHADFAEIGVRISRRELKGQKKVELDRLIIEVEDLEVERARVTQLIDDLEREREHLLQHREMLYDSFRARGGELFQERESIEQALAQVNEALAEKQRDMAVLLGGALPLAGVRSRLERLLERHRQVEDTRAKAMSLAAIRNFAENIVADLRQVGASETMVQVINRRVDQLVASSSDELTAAPSFHLLGGQAAALLEGLLASGLDEQLARWRQLESVCADLRIRASDLRARLERVPDEEQIAQLLSELRDVDLKLEFVARRIGDAQQKSAELERELMSRRRLLEQKQVEMFELEDSERVLNHIRLARERLSEFRKRMLARHLERIESNITQSFVTLARKSQLVSRILIDQETLQPVLYDDSGRTIGPESLSAGERQMLATAILWGLARSSRKALPAVIDTPVGRLDSQHRHRLVSSYFPQASHQVVLLSTDEEIVGEHLARLRPWIARTYRIDHDDRTRSSRIVRGYFGEELVA